MSQPNGVQPEMSDSDGALREEAAGEKKGDWRKLVEEFAKTPASKKGNYAIKINLHRHQYEFVKKLAEYYDKPFAAIIRMCIQHVYAEHRLRQGGMATAIRNNRDRIAPSVLIDINELLRGEEKHG